jgi:serine/threonine-protein kinase
MIRASDWNDLSERLDELLGLDAPGQQAFLLALEQSRPAIAQRLRELLASRSAMEDARFLEDAREIHAALPYAESALIGAQIGPWTIESEVGRGGMGSVWRARRSDGHFDGLAAIKFLHFAELGSEGEQRFRREGHWLGQLDHPNISRLIDAGVHGASHQPYLVMEYVDGKPIDEWCDDGKLGTRDRIGLFLRVLDAVAHAHRHLIIHRDLKPTNIFVSESGTVKLLDFGIAKLANQENPARQTRSSVAAMTPQFAAPEQLRGEAITTRTDIYALGLVLYRLLTGRHAFEATPDKSWQDLRGREPPLMSETARRDRPIEPSELRGDLDTIVAKALRPDPELRYGSVEALGDDLVRFLRKEPIAARPTTFVYRTQKFLQRHGGAVLVAAIAVLSLIAAVVISTQQMLEARRQRDVATLETRRAEASSDFMQLILSESRDAQNPLTIDELLTRSVNMLEQQYGDDPMFRARMLLMLAQERASRHEYKQAFDLMEAAGVAARAGSDIEFEAQVDCAYSFQQSGRSELNAAQMRLASAQRKLRQILTTRWETDVQCLRAEANIVGGRPDGGRAASDRTLALLNQARETMEVAGATHRRDYTALLSHLAVVHRGRGEIARAFEFVQLGGRIHEQNGRGQTRSRLIALNNEAALFAQMGEFSAAHLALSNLFARLARMDTSSQNMGSFKANYVVAAVRMGGADRESALQLLPGIVAEAAERSDIRVEINARTAQLAALIEDGSPLPEIDAKIASINSVLDAPGREVLPEFRTALLPWLVRRDLLAGDAVAARGRVDPWIRTLRERKDNRLLAEVMLVSAELAFDTRDFARALAESEQARDLAQRLARAPDTSGRVGDALMIGARALDELGKRESARLLAQRALRCLTNGYGTEHSRTRSAQRFLSRLDAA